MNRTIKLLILSDILTLTGFGLIAPILAIFIKDNLIGGTIFTAGIASTIFLITKSSIQLPFSRYVDKHDDKVKWLIVGTFVVSLVPWIYIFSDHIYLIYVAEIIHGIGSGIVYPTWLGLWSLNLDRKQESFEWSFYSTCISIGTAITAAIGAAMAEFVGFTITFLVVWAMSLVGFGILFFLERKERKKRKITPEIKHYPNRIKATNGRNPKF
ncbi:MAG: MFS transporter [Nanoarchaeota archaeon]